MNTIILDSERQRTFCETMLKESKIDGSKTVIFKNTDSSSTARQRRLQWKWNGEVAMSGLGQDDDKNAVHIRAKMMFAHPILMRDDEVYPILYDTFKKAVKGSDSYALYIKEFADQYISTERLTKQQRSEYLRGFQMYWAGKGANLSDPSMQGVDLNFNKEKQ